MNEKEENDALCMALRKSVEDTSEDQSSEANSPSVGGRENAVSDPSFVNELLGSVGVDQSDPLMQAALQQFTSSGRMDDKRSRPDAGKNDAGNDRK